MGHPGILRASKQQILRCAQDDNLIFDAGFLLGLRVGDGAVQGFAVEGGLGFWDGAVVDANFGGVALD
jgi:hypothetical protein